MSARVASATTEMHDPQIGQCLYHALRSDAPCALTVFFKRDALYKLLLAHLAQVCMRREIHWSVSNRWLYPAVHRNQAADASHGGFMARWYGVSATYL